VISVLLETVHCHRGGLNDVLDRYYQTAKIFGGEVIVRLTADCPVVDPGVIDQVVLAFLHTGADFAANRLPPPWKRTYPIGLDTEVCSFAALEQAWKEASQPYQREHVMPLPV
jgi:spore coat polysaccharide biosynthesis protein SpsF